MTTKPPAPTGLARISRLASPTDRARRSQEMLAALDARHKADAAAFLEVRDEACRELLGQGQNFREVADVIGLTRSAVAKRFPEFSPKRS